MLLRERCSHFSQICLMMNWKKKKKVSREEPGDVCKKPVRGGQRFTHTEAGESGRIINRAIHICFIFLWEHYHKFSRNTIHHSRAVSMGQQCRWALLFPLHPVKSKVWASSSSKPGGSRAGGRGRHFGLIQVVGRFQFCVLVGPRALSSCPQLGVWPAFLVTQRLPHRHPATAFRSFHASDMSSPSATPVSLQPENVLCFHEMQWDWDHADNPGWV